MWSRPCCCLNCFRLRKGIVMNAIDRPLDRPGVFHANINDYELWECRGDSEAAAITCRFDVYEKLEPNGEWIPWEYGQQIDGHAWIVKRDGTINVKGLIAFGDATGWDGSLDPIFDRTFKPLPVRIDCRLETYNGKERVKVAWINHHDYAGPGVRQVASSGRDDLIAKHQEKLRQLVAQRPRTSPPDAYSPPPAGEDDVPF